MEIVKVRYERKCDFVDFVRLKNRSGILGMSEQVRGEISFVEIYLEAGALRAVSEIIAEYIAEPYRNHLALFHIMENYPYVSDKEAEGIVHNLTAVSKEEIQKAVLLYLKANDTMDISGFVRFRLPSFRRDLIADTEQAAEDFFKKEEFEQMVSLLKNMAKGIAQYQTAHDEINVIFLGSDECRIVENMGSEAFKPELLTGFLVEMAPKRIILHQFLQTDPVLVRLIQSVFEDKVTLCEGCDICRI